MPRAFVSHSSTDDRYVQELVQLVRGLGYDEVFNDSHTIEPDEEFWPRIEAGIRNADAFVVVLSCASARSYWVDREVRLARSLSKRVIPVRIDGCKLPAEFDGRDVVDLRPLARRLQALNVLLVAALVLGIAGLIVFAGVAHERTARRDAERLEQALRRLEQRDDPFREAQEPVRQQLAPRPISDAREAAGAEAADAQFILSNGDDAQKALALLTLSRFDEADRLIEAQLAGIATPGPAHLYWLVLKARCRAMASRDGEATGLYESAIGQYPDDERLRLEYVNAILRPYTGWSSPYALAGNIRPGDSRQITADADTLNRARTQIVHLLRVEGPSPLLQLARPFLYFRLGLCYHIPLRVAFKEQFEMKPLREAALSAYQEAAEGFAAARQGAFAAEALHNAAVVNLCAANGFSDSGAPAPPGTDLRGELDAVASAALDLLTKAESHLDGSQFTFTHYKIAKRKAHALLRRPSGRQAESVRGAIALIKKAKGYPGWRHFDDLPIIYLESWAYQRLAEYEYPMANLTLAVRSFKQQSAHYFNRDGHRCVAKRGGGDLPGDDGTPTVAFSPASFDGGEPAIVFTFYRRWLALGGTYQQYLELRPLDSATG